MKGIYWPHAISQHNSWPPAATESAYSGGCRKVYYWFRLSKGLTQLPLRLPSVSSGEVEGNKVLPEAFATLT